MCSHSFSHDVRAEHGGRAGADPPAEEVRPLLRQPRRPKSFWKQGEPFVWATGAALALTLTLTGMLIFVVLSNGLGVFWPHPLLEVTLSDGSKLLGEEVERQIDPRTGLARIKYKVGNREEGSAFCWIDAADVAAVALPLHAFKLDRTTDLNYYGYLKEIRAPGFEVPAQGDLPARLSAALAAARAATARDVAPLAAEEAALAKQLNDQIKYEAIDVGYRRTRLLRGGISADSAEIRMLDVELAALSERESRIKEASHALTQKRAEAERNLLENLAVFANAAGQEKSIALGNIVRFSCPNRMGFGEKVRFYLAKIWEMLSAQPREANQDGGLFPAIFGTVLLVFLMAVTCFPLGVLAGVYLGEYAKEGPLVRLVRVAVNNLAGIPSIVYGIFGLGFFIYTCGGYLDQLLYPERVDASEPVFGQGCILWASLTLGLLTIPVVIVSTEEALRAIPRDVREGSYALGATKLQTLARVLVPMASPGMMTGFVLAMARAAGEVAPLMITGAVKSAPLPLEASFPFVRLDRQFMHLGFHIFDISCKSPNVEATKPMVYVTTVLLLFIVITMTSLAIWLRNRMRKRYQLRAI